MDNLDASTWQALGLTLTVVGLLISVLLWKRRGPASGTRGAAWSLLPLAAGLTGTLHLLWDIGDSIVRWAVHLVFSPLVWIGVAVGGVSLLLFAVSAAMRARGVGSAPRRRAAADAPRSDAALTKERSHGRAQPAVRDEDMDDIESILRKHGIS